MKIEEKKGNTNNLNFENHLKPINVWNYMKITMKIYFGFSLKKSTCFQIQMVLNDSTDSLSIELKNQYRRNQEYAQDSLIPELSHVL